MNRRGAKQAFTAWLLLFAMLLTAVPATADDSIDTLVVALVAGGLSVPSEVSDDFQLPLTGDYGALISWSWTSDQPGLLDINAATGRVTVNRPLGDTFATLTSLVTCNTASLTSLFNIKVLGISDRDAVEASVNAVTWDGIRGANASAAASPSSLFEVVTSLAPLPQTGRHGTDVSWSFVKTPATSSFNLNPATGAVTMPDVDTIVQLTATVARHQDTAASATSMTKTFILDVKTPLFDQAVVDEVARLLAWDNIRGVNAAQTAARPRVTADLDLTPSRLIPASVTIGTTSGVPTQGVTITWAVTGGIASATVNTGANLGAVTFPQSGNRNITLTATVARNDASSSKSFDLSLISDAEVIEAVRNWLTWDRVRGNNAQQSAVTNTASSRYGITANLILNPALPAFMPSDATLSTQGVTVSWMLLDGIETATVDTLTGMVTFPQTGNREVRLVATVRRNSTAPAATREFFAALLPSPDQAAVNEAMTKLSWEAVRGFNDPNTGDGPYLTMTGLVTPSSYVTADGKTVTVRWASSHPAIVAINGSVSVPTAGTADVTLTASFTFGTVTASLPFASERVFRLEVRAPSDADAVRIARGALTWDTIKNRNTDMLDITSGLALPTSGECSTSITWVSNNPPVISNTGVVNRPEDGVTVILTATIRRGAIADTKSFHLLAGTPVFAVTVTANGETAEMPAAHFAKLSENGTKGVSVKMGVCTIILDAAAARAVFQAGGSVFINAEHFDKSWLPYAAWLAVGDRPALKITLRADGRLLTGLGGGTAVIEMAYTADEDEIPGSVMLYRLDERSGAMTVLRGFYDGAGKRVRFLANDFAVFVIGYSSLPAFKDQTAVASSWGLDHIAFTVSRKLFSGHADGSFDPDGPMTRAQFAAVLRNYDGADLNQSKYARNRFTDGAGWYTGILAWGDDMGLFAGYGFSAFFPDLPITRADMAVMLYNYAVAKGIKLEPVRTVTFPDISSLSFEQRNAIQTLANAGVVSGYLTGRFEPSNQSSRAEVAAIMGQFVRAF
jgi:hypothetical protein